MVWETTHLGNFLKDITPFCYQKYWLHHQMCNHPQLKIVPNKCIIFFTDTKESTLTCANAHKPVSPTSVIHYWYVLKDLHGLQHICDKMLASSDPLRFASRPSRSAEDACPAALEQLEGRNTYVGLFFIDFSSASNTILPTKQCLGHSICAGVYDFLSGRLQTVRSGQNHSFIFTLSTGSHRDAALVFHSIVSSEMTVSPNISKCKLNLQMLQKWKISPITAMKMPRDEGKTAFMV